MGAVSNAWRGSTENEMKDTPSRRRIVKEEEEGDEGEETVNQGDTNEEVQFEPPSNSDLEDDQTTTTDQEMDAYFTPLQTDLTKMHQKCKVNLQMIKKTDQVSFKRGSYDILTRT